MNKGLQALKKIEKELSKCYGSDVAYYPKVFELLKTIGNDLQTLNVLKELCLEGKDKYGEGTWGWVEFDLDKHPKLKEWLENDN